MSPVTILLRVIIGVILAGGLAMWAHAEPAPHATPKVNG